MSDDAVFLARIQSSFRMAFRILFPSFMIGLVA
jgi:hypothetical protein